MTFAVKNVSSLLYLLFSVFTSSLKVSRSVLDRIWIQIRRIRTFLGLPDPDPSLFCTNPDPDPSLFCTNPDPNRFIKKPNKKKNLDFYYFVTSFWLFIYENWYKVPLKSNKQKTLTKNLPSCQPLTKKQDPAGSVIQCGPDPRIRIRIHTKMLRIHNNGFAPRM